MASGSGQSFFGPHLVRDLKILSCLLVPVFLETLDYTLISEGQTHIASAFNALNLQSWIGTSYLITNCTFLPLYAATAVMFGRFAAMQVALWSFLLGSIISTVGESMVVVAVGRGIQGVGGAGFLMVVQIILADSGLNTSQPHVLVMYAIAFVVGPVISGPLVEDNFRWFFGINLICLAVGIPLSFVFLRKMAKKGDPIPRLPTSTQENYSIFEKLVLVDWLGIALMFLSSLCIVLALSYGPFDAWKSGRFIASLVLGIILFFATIAWEWVLLRARQDPTRTSTLAVMFRALPLEAFKHPNVIAIQFGNLLSGMSMYQSFYFVVIFGALGQGRSINSVSIQILFYVPGMFVGSIITRRLMSLTHQPKYPAMIGLVAIVIGSIIGGIGAQKDSNAYIDASLALFGLGGQLTIGPLIALSRAVEGDLRPRVLGLLPFFRSLGGLIALAQSFAIMNAKVRSYLAHAATDSSAYSAFDRIFFHNLSTNDGVHSLEQISQLPSTVQGVVEQAYRFGVHWTFFALIPWAGLALVLSPLMQKVPYPPPESAVEGQQAHGEKPEVATSEGTPGSSVSQSANEQFAPPAR
ncbi:MFS general substrate transporter [Coniophora puteana RWD-64-598 SS2]|uniref:MFS general substrate transporter n=1 Tax=Coniophora puteana (strain RWD-64-598) TaxID=741705 RepID=A0A5M3MLK0_CONPW|nr:MFS general substrate transporter [Coniophora puteana RWD-64-598 SS2]EIW79936.1 MFS general substrate transporter [Coniophora puteana RWD-64-598 SS2]